MSGRRTPKDMRNRDLARIHVGKKALRLDDETYRDMLFQMTGRSSSADLSPLQRGQVIARMHKLGWMEDNQANGNHPGRPRNVDAVPMLGKVEALLADAKRPWSYAHGIAKRMFHTEKVEWLRPDQLHKAVSAMQADANRRAKRESTP